MKELDLGWGNPYFLTEFLDIDFWGYRMEIDLLDMNYAPDQGNERLLRQVRDITKMNTGKTYKYYGITNGATQAINSILRTQTFEKELDTVTTNPLSYPFYPGMIQKVPQLFHENSEKLKDIKEYYNRELILLDSPSNPLGEQYVMKAAKKSQIIWDAVYHNKAYNADLSIIPKHNVFVGSMSKLLGLSGVRIGWIATNDKKLFDEVMEDSLMENATVSKISQDFISGLLEDLDLENFMEEARDYLNDNRKLFKKLEKLTGAKVPKVGMFYCFPVKNKKIPKLFDKNKIKYVTMNDGNTDYIRLNMGQTTDVIEEMLERLGV